MPPPPNANLRALQKRLDSPSFGDTPNLCLAYTYPAFLDLLAIGIVTFVHFFVNFKHGSMGDNEHLDDGIAVPGDCVHLKGLNLGAWVLWSLGSLWNSELGPNGSLICFSGRCLEHSFGICNLGAWGS